VVLNKDILFFIKNYLLKGAVLF